MRVMQISSLAEDTLAGVWCVVAGAELRHLLPLVSWFFCSSPESNGKPSTLNQRISLRIHHNGKNIT